MNFAILLAAGKSQRTGRKNKVFYPIKGKPLVFYALLTFEKHPKIQKITAIKGQVNNVTVELSKPKKAKKIAKKK